MENPSDLTFDQKEFSYFLYGGQPEFETFLAHKQLKNKFDFLKFRPETYANEANQHLEEEGKVLIELVKLHKSKQLNLQNCLPYLKDLTHYSRSIETHFNIFKNIALSFSSDKNTKALQTLINNINIVGSVLYQEFDYTRNTVDENVETIAIFNPETRKFLLSTAPNKAKLCRHFTPHSTHVIIFARIRLPTGSLTAAYPFFVQIRNPESFELAQGFSMKWLGPSFGGISGREYAFELNNLAIDADKLLLDKYVSCSGQKLEITGDNAVLEFTTRISLLLEQDQAIEKSVREGLKAAFLVVRHANNRTQFQTLEEKGKERPIFEYNFNKQRIMKALVEMLNFHIASFVFRRKIQTILANPQKNVQLLNDVFVFFDMFEAYVNERCLLVVESLRESIGGIGYLKFSGIPNLQENAMKNAVFTGHVKELRYLRFAQLFITINLQNPGDFIKTFANWLIKGPVFDDVVKADDFHQKTGIFGFYLSKKLLYYREKIIAQTPIKPSDDCREVLKGITNFDNITKLCEAFVLYTLSYSLITRMSLNLNRGNQKFLLLLDAVNITVNMLNDVPFYFSQEGKLWPEGSLDLFKKNLSLYIDALGKRSIDIVESFGFDESLLHSCISKTADETYEKMFNMSKNHNPRNDPKVQAEIRKNLLEFLNRPASPKL